MRQPARHLRGFSLAPSWGRWLRAPVLLLALLGSQATLSRGGHFDLRRIAEALTGAPAPVAHAAHAAHAAPLATTTAHVAGAANDWSRPVLDPGRVPHPPGRRTRLPHARFTPARRVARTRGVIAPRRVLRAPAERPPRIDPSPTFHPPRAA